MTKIQCSVLILPMRGGAPHVQVAGSGVFIGSADNAHDLESLRQNRITHIVNMVCG